MGIQHQWLGRRDGRGDAEFRNQQRRGGRRHRLCFRSLSGPSPSRGIALVEVVIAIVIVAIAATTIMSLISRANVQSGRQFVQAQAASIAATYLNEIQNRPFLDPDGVDGEAQRQAFDDVDDYQGLNDVGARDASGNALPGGAGFTVVVTVAADGTLPSAPASDARRITVQVTDPAGAIVRLSGIRLRP